MNTTRAANNYLVSQKESNRTITFGAIGKDIPSEMIVSMLNEEKINYSLHQDAEVPTGLCAVTVNNVDRTCIAILDACEKYPSTHM